MSEIVTRRQSNPRLRLLTTVSSIVLIANTCGLEAAFAGNPPFWVEVGIQNNRVYDSKDPPLPLNDLLGSADLSASFFDAFSLKRSSDAYAKVSFQSEDSNWIFSASVIYGRAHHKANRDSTTAHVPVPTAATFATYHTTIPTYPFPWHRTQVHQVGENASFISGGQATRTESHLIVDFEAGRDVGLGMFGSSTLSAGVRIANFRSAVIVSNVQGVQDVQFDHFQHTHPTYAFFPSSVKVVPWFFNFYNNNWRSLLAAGRSSESFDGVGPSLSWEASTPLWGKQDHGGQILLDWGVNAGVLFGRRKYSEEHHTSEAYHCVGRYCGTQPDINVSGSTNLNKNTTVPNLGGSIGISYQLGNMKLNAGYRADFFFGAMPAGDAGTGTSTVGFHGPYASLSVGVGG